jgi:hypothetical protein
MLTVYIRVADDQLEIGRGEFRARFERQGSVWVPTWIWQGDQRMLRFRNHEWLALGPLRPNAQDWEILEDSADRVVVRFNGDADCEGVPVEWAVEVAVESSVPGFTFTTEILPARTLELLECFSAFELPPEYDGREEFLCVIGQNPVVEWRGDQLLTPPAAVAPPGAPPGCGARGASRAPICCFRVLDPQTRRARHATVMGHWDVCAFHTLSVAPTAIENGARSYEIRAGGLDWQGGEPSEPNVFLEGGHWYRQRVSIHVASDMPGGSLDRWLFGAFERSVRHFLPTETALEAERCMRGPKESLAQISNRLIDLVSGNGVEGLFSPERGMVRYMRGTCPGAGIYSPRELTPWIGALGYQACITGDGDLHDACVRLLAPVMAAIDDSAGTGYQPVPLSAEPFPSQESWGSVFDDLLPLLRYLACFPDAGLQGVVRQMIERMLEAWPPERGKGPDLDGGSEALNAEAYFLAGAMADDPRLIRAGLLSLERVNAAVRDRFWRFGCSSGPPDVRAGGQARPIGYAHALAANLLAWQRSRQDRYMEMASTFARLLVSICFATYNRSGDPDFDTRGFADGALSGLDRLIDCSLIESSDSLRCLAWWLSLRPDLPTGYYDLLYLFSRSFLGAFPAARRTRSGLTVGGQPVGKPVDQLPEQSGYRRFPYIACENALGQLRQSPRAALEAVLNTLLFGGALASCEDERFLVLVPRVGGCDLAERVSRMVHVYNPWDKPGTAVLAIHQLPRDGRYHVIAGNRRIATAASTDALNRIEIAVPARRAVVVEVVLSRETTTAA